MWWKECWKVIFHVRVWRSAFFELFFFFFLVGWALRSASIRPPRKKIGQRTREWWQLWWLFSNKCSLLCGAQWVLLSNSPWFLVPFSVFYSSLVCARSPSVVHEKCSVRSLGVLFFCDAVRWGKEQRREHVLSTSFFFWDRLRFVEVLLFVFWVAKLLLLHVSSSLDKKRAEISVAGTCSHFLMITKTSWNDLFPFKLAH